MRNFLVASIFIIFASGCIREQSSKAPGGFVKIGRIDSIFSKSLNEERQFWVYLPYGAEREPDPGKKYPVLYLLDGDAHFPSVAGLIHQLSAVNGNMLCPEMIVVAIPNTNRTRDLTPSHSASFGDDTSGGAENFTHFLEALIKHIEEHYPVSSYRTLIGHSFGGLFAINTLMHHRELFDNYLAIDPSLWWDEQKLLKESKHLLDTSRFDKKYLYVAMAHTVKRGMTVKDLSTDTTQSTRHMRSIIDFCDYAIKKTGNGLTFESKYYPDDGHSSVVMISEHDALRSMFSWYPMNELEGYYGADSKQPAEEMIGIINAHYKKVSDHFGYEVKPDKQVVNDLGYYFMSNNRSDRAIALFTLNEKNYTSQPSVFNALGDFYLHEKDTTQAINNFKKALSISDDKGIQEKLEKLNQSHH